MAPAPTDKPTVPNLPDVNSDLLQLVIEDQWDRGNDMFGNRQVQKPNAIDWKQVGQRDEQRREQVRKLLAGGRITTGQEYYFAALIFQHSDQPEGFMLAHVLAVTAVGKGDGLGKWLAAATLDRYLQSVHQPQIFGTQFFTPSSEKQGWTMEPYNRDILSDDERALWCVVPLYQQEQILRDIRAGKPLVGTQISDCK
jgi:hypothetical protein